jgi:glycosyltransferase involved in cell wall biosynthesis
LKGLARKKEVGRDAVPRVIVVGASSSQICGVRDYARVTAEAMVVEGASVTTLWWERDLSWGRRRTIAEARRWLADVAEAVERQRPDWILWHYSVFTWGLWGIPFLSLMAARRLARTGVPLLTVLHEFAFPFGDGGLRGLGWAIAHRVTLLPVWRACARAIVTTEERAQWLKSRRWLPTRPVSFLPVCSNLPAVLPDNRSKDGLSIGVFGFQADRSLAERVVGALARLHDDGLATRLVLVGAPGDEGPAADAWLRAAANCGFEPLSFTGILPAPEIARAVASVDVIVFADSSGSMSRKTTLAAALALAKPVVAMDGPGRWRHLVEANAVVVARPNADEIAAALRPLLLDEVNRDAQGTRGRNFYRRWMAPDVLARASLDFIALNTEPRLQVASQ